MIDASLAFFWPDAMLRQTFIGGDVSPGATTTDAYRLWHTKDGQIIYLLATQVEHEGFFAALGHPETLKKCTLHKPPAASFFKDPAPGLRECSFEPL